MSTNFYETQVATVDYQIIFTRRDFEAVLEHGTTSVAKAMSGNGFASWRIAQYIRDTGGVIDVPSIPEWADRTVAELNKILDTDLGGNRVLRRDALEYLQVEFQVLSTLERKPTRYDQDKVTALDLIAAGVGRGAIIPPVGIDDLPTKDPHVPGALWNDQGAVKVST